MKATNEDHKLLRSITRETITNDMDLMDFGLQLGYTKTLVEQKLHNHPRSIEMASFMLAAEWWDSSGDSRKEKYGLVFDAVCSMGKKCTADKFKNVVLDASLAQIQGNSGCRSSSVSSCQHQDMNSQPVIEAAPSNQTVTTHLAICNAEGPVVQDVSNSSYNIVEISNENEAERSNIVTPIEQDQEVSPRETVSVDQIRWDNDKLSLSKEEHVTGVGSVGQGRDSDDLFEAQKVKTVTVNKADIFHNVDVDTHVAEEAVSGVTAGSVCSVDVEKGRPEHPSKIEGDMFSQPTKEYDMNFLESTGKAIAMSLRRGFGENDGQAQSTAHSLSVNVFHTDNTGNEDEGVNMERHNREIDRRKKFSSKTKNKLNGLESVDLDKHSDVSQETNVNVSPDSGLFDLFAPDVQASINLDDPDVVNKVLPEVPIKNSLYHQVPNTICEDNNVNVKNNSKHRENNRVNYGISEVRQNYSSVVSYQTDREWSETCSKWSDRCSDWSDRCSEWSDRCSEWSDRCSEWSDRCSEWSDRCSKWSDRRRKWSDRRSK